MRKLSPLTLVVMFAFSSSLSGQDPPYKYDLTLRISSIVAKKVVEGPFDNEEDLYGYCEGWIPNNSKTVYFDFVSCGSAQLYKIGALKRTIGVQKKIIENLTFNQLINKELNFDVEFSDQDNGVFGIASYDMVEGNRTNNANRSTGCFNGIVAPNRRKVLIKQTTSAYNHLKTLVPSSALQPIKMGNDFFLETNMYEHIGDAGSSHIVIYWQVLVDVKNP